MGISLLATLGNETYILRVWDLTTHSGLDLVVEDSVVVGACTLPLMIRSLVAKEEVGSMILELRLALDTILWDLATDHQTCAAALASLAEGPEAIHSVALEAVISSERRSHVLTTPMIGHDARRH